jgi:uncharacterized protein (TIGR04255 family)
MSNTKLKNAPLKEVIFELFWNCSIDGTGMQVDEGFDLAQGIFSNKLKSQFPVHRKLIPENIPFKVFGAPIHQYWKGQMQWPVVQHGQGMIAINETEKGYVWEETFKPTIITIIKQLVESYDRKLTFNKCRLQYINAWELIDQEPINFVRENLQTQISTEYPTPGIHSGFNIQSTFQLEQETQMALTITNGINNQNQNKSVIWTTLVEKNSKMHREDVINWIGFAHDHTSAIFKQILNPDFYASLDQ